MLTNKKYEETKNGQVSLEHFEQATVISFLEYMYAGAINDPKTIQKIRAAFGPNTYIYKRSFEQEKLTLDLLRMADMYEVEDLKVDCSEYLKKTICDNNVMEVLIL